MSQVLADVLSAVQDIDDDAGGVVQKQREASEAV
jgi:hypothetical protein